MVYQTKNPYTGEVVKTFPDATDAEVSDAISQAHKSFLAWRETSFSHRGSILQKAADLLRSQSDELAALLTLEMGKLLSEAKAEVELCAGMLETARAGGARAAWRAAVRGAVELPVLPDCPHHRAAAGGRQHDAAEARVERSAVRRADGEADAGRGAACGCFKNLYATREQVNTIIADPRVHGVALTGSEGAGIVVAVEAAKAVKKSTMELGGADAFIVLKDADLEKAVKWGVIGRHWNAGQVCVSSKRMIIADEIFDDYLKLYTAGVEALKCGDPMDPSTTLAPLSSQGAADELKEQIKLAVAHGARAIEVGPKVPAKGAFLQPTILLDVTPQNPAYRMEFFGPVSMLLRFKTEEEAIHIANDSPYGLGGSVFTKDEKRGQEIASKIETGMVFVNHPTR
ncbi:succinate-semialdehyde dehydrogenase [NADP(+)]-like, partial [Bactrocera neohumeralis]|uniref:succinate-semialdehyde dehydrogenase [NADP(+)]-like n=1 Tax=Bactrocera neohumeralis TaxID=98809 RepID=UPI002166A625